jgi:hypothetical protein
MYRCHPACHDAFVQPYEAYLRVYEPLSAFTKDEGQRWADYAASTQRPRWSAALDTEQAEAMGRMIASPPVAAPEQESGQAYVRWADGVTYICPWQTQLRSWLALTRLRATARPLVTTAFPEGQADAALREFARWQGQASSLRVFIQACTWSVPAAWFVPFAPEERWLVLGGDPGTGEPADVARATRTLSYATAMPQARRRIARALNAVCGGGDALSGPPGRAGDGRLGAAGLADGLGGRRSEPGGPGGGDLGHGLGGRGGGGSGHSGAGSGRRATGTGVLGPWPAAAEIAQVGRWLEEFHPHSVVELDYGGLVHLLDDDSLRADQSVAEVSAAISACRKGQQELAIALYQRMRSRWQALESLEAAN